VSRNWNPNSVNQSLICRGRDAHLRLKECLGKAKTARAYQIFADEAAAKASIYDYLDGRSFLHAREALLSALRELAAMRPPNVDVFDRECFVQERQLIIDGLIREFE
jgi:hypothetical protein